jgi:hypothetical protein
MYFNRLPASCLTAAAKQFPICHLLYNGGLAALHPFRQDREIGKIALGFPSSTGEIVRAYFYCAAVRQSGECMSMRPTGYRAPEPSDTMGPGGRSVSSTPQGQQQLTKFLP